MELADLGRLYIRARRVVQLPVLRPVSHHARFPVGQPIALSRGRNPARRRTRPRVWTAGRLPWEDFWFRSFPARAGRVCLFRLRNFLCPAAGTAFGAGAESGRTSASLQLAGSKRQTSGPGRHAFAQWRGADFLSRTLVTTL